MEFLFAVLDRLFDVPLVERIRIEGVESPSALALKDGGLVSLIRLSGSFSMQDPERFASDAEEIRIALSPFLSKPGHAIEFSYSRDPAVAAGMLEDSVEICRSRARLLGLDVGGILSERRRRLSGILAAETCLIAVHTSPPELRGRKKDGNEGAGSERSAEARHDALAAALCRTLRSRDMDARILDSVDALREIRASIHPPAAAQKGDWIPAGLKKGVASPILQEQFGLDCQLAAEDAEIIDRRIVRIGDSLFAGFDMTVGPEILKPFSGLVDAMAAVTEPFAWRCSFLLEPCGMESLRFKEQFAKLFAFTAPVRNGRIRDCADMLREIDGSEDTVVRLKISFATWAPVGQEALLRRHAAALGRTAEQWGNLSVDGVSGDPLATALSSAITLAPDSTAPPAAAPLSHALSLMPFGRQAAPWDSGPVLLRTDDGKVWPYRPGSSLQNSWVEIYAGSSGSGKSVAMNAINFAAALSAGSGEGGTAELPRMAIIDIGHSSKGLIDLIRDALPEDRTHEAAHMRMRMTPDHCVNPFDTPPGMRLPYASGRMFLVNFLSVLAGAGTDGSGSPLIGLLGAAVDQAYRQSSDREQPKRYVAGEEPEVDKALGRIGFEFAGFSTWWEAADALFGKGMLGAASMAQARAVPVLADMIDASHADQIVGLYGEARVSEGGEPLLAAFRRSVSEAIRDFPALAGVTRFNPGHARIIALDLDEAVSAEVGADGHRRSSLMFMLARQLLIRDWFLDAAEAEAAAEAEILPAAYLDYHRRLSVFGRRTPKLFAMDEFHRCGGLPGFRRQILQDAREGRKNNIRIALSSQSIGDFGDEVLDAATSIFIFDASSESSADRIAGQFGLSGQERRLIRAGLTGPGPSGAPLFAVIRHKGGVSRQKLNLTLGAAELWALATAPEDVALRECLYGKFSASDALLLLAARFPSGSAKPELERAAARSLRNGESRQMRGAGIGIIETVAAELEADYRGEVISRMGAMA